MARLLASLVVLAATTASLGGTFSSFSSTVSNSLELGSNSTFAPISTAVPAISGTIASNQSLTVQTAGTYRSNLTVSRSYQWQLCTSLLVSTCVDIAGAVGSTYALGLVPLGSFFRVVETAGNGYGTVTAASGILS